MSAIAVRRCWGMRRTLLISLIRVDVPMGPVESGPSVKWISGCSGYGGQRPRRPCRTLIREMATVLTGIDRRSSPVSAAEVALVRQPVADAHMLPPRVFHDPEVFDFEQEHWFARTWVCVGRESDIPSGGNYIVVDV